MPRVHLLAALIVLLALLLAEGCRQTETPAPAAEVFCVDTQTGEFVVLANVAQFPAVNPATGKATLMPGLYCPKCQSWHAAPPLEQLHRQRGVAYCPKTGAVLASEGPRPSTTSPP